MNYEQRLRAVGRLIDRTELRGVCILEHDHGVLVVGLAPVTIADEHVTQPASIEFDEASIESAAADPDGPNTTLEADGTASPRPALEQAD